MKSALDSRIRARLAGKTAIVTGGASGIGKAVCALFAGDGVSVLVADLRQESVDAAVGELAGKGAISGMAVDVRSETDMAMMAEEAVRRFGTIDILVHSAGILRARDSGPKTLLQLSEREWDEVIETNLKGTFFCNRAVAAVMAQQKKGMIINVASVSGRKGRAFDSAYCASKFGMMGLTESLAEEMRQYGVRVHALLPDAVDTPLWEQNGPIKAPGYSLAPERAANLIRYIASLPEGVAFGDGLVAPFAADRAAAKPAPREEPA
jgi:NAD(P)-dependent dehydrogenase (short-subunit alcohol dehydrogenase family)